MKNNSGITKNKVTGKYDVRVQRRVPGSKTPIHLRESGLDTLAAAQRGRDCLLLRMGEELKAQAVPLWPKLVDDFLKERRCEVSPSTFKNELSILTTLSVKLWSNKLVDSIGTRDVSDLLEEQMGNSSSSHKRNLLKALKRVFEFALARRMIAHLPIPKVRFQKKETVRAVLTMNDARKFLPLAKELEPQWYPIWCAALYAGMRSGELYALKWTKVDFEHRQIAIDESWESKAGYKSTKSGDGRIAEISEELLQVLKTLKLKTGNQEFVFPHLSKWTKGEQARVLRRFLIGIGMQPIKFHDLRASWATMLLVDGVPAIKVMQMGGWKDLKTMQFYVRRAGVDIKGITKGLTLHDPNAKPLGDLIQMPLRSQK